MANSPPFLGAAGSRLVLRLRRRYDKHLHLLPHGAPTQETLAACFQALQADYPQPADGLRVLRQLCLERLVVQDCEQQATLELVTRAMTCLAEFTLDIGLREALARVALRHGWPRRSDGTVAQLWVVGMGKLGAAELNVSSDIDLVYVYDEDGETRADDGDCVRIDNHVFFDKVVKQLFQLIGEPTKLAPDSPFGRSAKSMRNTCPCSVGSPIS